MSAKDWADALPYPCPYCLAPASVRCRSVTGKRATMPHAERLAPRFVCPVCATVSDNPNNVAAGYCPVCADWTGGDGLAPGQPTFDLGDLGGLPITRERW